MKRAFLIVGLLVFGSVVVVAQEDGDDGPGRGERPSPIGMLVRFFELDETQMTTFEELLTTRHETIEPLVQEAREIGIELREAINAPEPDPFAIGELVLSEKAVKDEIREAELVFSEGFRDMLTEEQMGLYFGLARASRLTPVVRAAAEVKLMLLPPEGEREGDE